MTIQQLHTYAGRSPGVYTLGSTEEARLIGLGLARDYTPGMDGKNSVFSNAEQAALQALVSGGGIAVLRSALLVGDSITAYQEVFLTATSVTDNADGTATVVRTGHGLSVGQYVRIAAAPTQALCVMAAPVIQIVDANTYKIQLAGYTHTVTSPSGPVMGYADRKSCRGWYHQLEGLAGEPLATTLAAVPGARTTHISALLDQFAAGVEDMAFVCIGMNDIYSAGQSLAQLKIDFSALMVRVAKRCVRICVLSVPPRLSSDGNWSAGKQTVHTAYNRWLYEQCKASGWLFVDTWRAAQGGATYVNQAATNPDPLAAMAVDTTHPSWRGAAAIAASVWTQVSRWFGVSGWKAAHPALIGADMNNILTGSDFAAGSGGVATGWSMNGSTANMSVTPTLAARTVASDGDACGQNQIITINYGTAAGIASTRFRKDNIQASLTAGQRYYMAIPYSVTGALGLTGLEAVMFGAVGSDFWLVYANSQDSNDDAMQGNFSGYLITPVATCPAGLTDLDIWVRPYITSAQSTDMVLKVWQPVIVPV